MNTDKFNYKNTEIKLQNGGKIVRKVLIKKGKGYKSVTKFFKNKKISTVKKKINNKDVNFIKNGKFIPGLFLDCKCNKSRKSKH